MASKVADCIGCGGAGNRLGWSSQEFPLAECARCGLSYYANWPALLAHSASFHEGNAAYYERMEDDPDAVIFQDVNLRRGAEVLGKLERLAPSKTLLDVGCGRGEGVSVAQNCGWQAMGIDLAPGAIRIAQAHGLNCRNLDFFSSGLDVERFGLIVMSEFLEHVPQPGRFLARAHELLVPGGVLYLTTPNFGSLGRRVHGELWSPLFIGHVAFFNRRTIANLAQRAGFRVARIETGVVSVSAIKSVVTRTKPSRAEQVDAIQTLRSVAYGSRWGRLAKRVIEPAVAVSGLGETLKATLIRA